VTWLYQPLPLASTLTAGSDAEEALTGEASASGIGSCTPDSSVALSGSASTCSSGSFNVEILATNLITSAAGSTTSANNSVRLRSRKTGGASGTATQELSGITLSASAQSIDSIRVVSVLLGGTGVAVSQQSFPVKTHAHLLGGIQRTMSAGTMIGTQSSGTGSIPSWVQLPTWTDEIAYYETNFGIGSGKEEAWAWIPSDQVPNTTLGFTAVAPVSIGTTGHNFPGSSMHGDSEADDLWNHYMQYKRSGENRYLSWATEWKNYFISDTETGYLDDLQDTVEDDNNFDHIYGQGLVMWGVEQNDAAARARAEAILAVVEAHTYTLVPGVNSMSRVESRAYARRLIVACYVSMMNPTARWVDLRNHLIDLWVQSPGWEDSTNGIIQIGGNHFCGRPAGGGSFAGWTAAVYDLGFRWNAAHHYGLHNEALWLAYKLTGRTDVRDMLVQMGRYTLYYAWDPRHVNSMHGTRWGHRPDGTHLAAWSDEYNITTPGVPDPAGQQPNWTDETTAPTDNNEISDVNGLVYAYKLTGETAFLKRAREHLRMATCFSSFAAGATKLAENEVHFFLDTRKDNSTRYFAGNKGLLQYSAHIFENGGAVSLEPSATWQPPYAVPTSPGEVIKIAGDLVPTSNTQIHQGGDATPSAYATNVFNDVRPSEVNTQFANTMLWSGDTRTKFIETFSPGGAMMIVGSGGHAQTCNNFGSCLFDFTDARWKRIWTTDGNPGVDNITNEGPRPVDGGPPTVDIRTGTKIHNCINYQANLVDGYYLADSHASGEICWNPTHWQPGGGGATAAQKAVVPLAADPRDQMWEVSLSEPTPYGSALAAHNWPYPGEWGGLGHGRFERSGYVTNTVTLGAGGRFDPTPAGTLEPTQSELPAPSHIWDHYYELRAEDGGGPRGSIITGRHQNAGNIGVTPLSWSHRFDLNTGIWHKWSANSPTSDPTLDEVDGGPAPQSSAIASAEDLPMKRVFMVAKTLGSSPYVNYANLLDRTWRSFQRGTGGVATSGLTECLVVDPDRRLLILTQSNAPYLLAIDLQTLGNSSAADPTNPTPTWARGGWKHIPYDDIPGVQSVAPFSSSAAPYTHGGNGYRNPWRYYPPNGKFYRMNGRSMGRDVRPSASAPYPNITVLERLTPPPIIATPRADFYYTTEASSGRWTLDEIQVGTNIGGLPAPDSVAVYAVAQAIWFHYVPALQCFAYAPTDFGSSVTTRRCVYLIKPF
jgi:hypothetical protein